MKNIVKHKGMVLLLLSCLSMSNAHASKFLNRDDVGVGVVTPMTQAFSNSHNSADCLKDPAYTCNGLMVSAFEDDPDNPNENDLIYWSRSNDKIRKLSMSYISKTNASWLFGKNGFVIWPKNDIDVFLKQQGSMNTFEPVYLCAYPFDGNTGNTFDIGDHGGDRPEHGCGAFKGQPDTVKCQALGISSVEQWWAMFGNNPGDEGCAFDLTQSDAKQAFDIKMGIREKTFSELHISPDMMVWDENILQPWPEEKPARVPVMAFFQMDGQSASNFDVAMKKVKNPSVPQGRSLEHTRQVQEEYYRVTKIFVPIITLTGWPKNPGFIYDPKEQSSTIPQMVNAFPE